jgi:hypothetical protein
MEGWWRGQGYGREDILVLLSKGLTAVVISGSSVPHCTKKKAEVIRQGATHR